MSVALPKRLDEPSKAWVTWDGCTHEVSVFSRCDQRASPRVGEVVLAFDDYGFRYPKRTVVRCFLDKRFMVDGWKYPAWWVVRIEDVEE